MRYATRCGVRPCDLLTDVRGVEISGAAKNAVAIACGVAAGRGLGASAVAARPAAASLSFAVSARLSGRGDRP